MNNLITIKELAKALIKAIDDNSMSGQVCFDDGRARFIGVIPNQFIADELEALRDAVK